MDDYTMFRIYDHILEEDLAAMQAAGDPTHIATAERLLADRIYDRTHIDEVADVVQDYLGQHTIREQLALIRKYTLAEPTWFERVIRWIRSA